MLDAWVHRWTGALPLRREPARPCDNAIWLEVRHPAQPEHEHRMGGYDNYWFDRQTSTYGCWNDPQNDDWYEGPAALAWVWTPTRHHPIEWTRPPSTATIARGVMVPDDVARELGLI